MNNITQQIKSQLSPVAALIAYRNDTLPRGGFYLELRQIDQQGVMEQAIPVSYDFMKQISKSFTKSSDKVLHGLVPPNMLWCDQRKGYEKYVWYNPPRKRMMFFATSLGIEDGEYHMPGVVYEAGARGLSIYVYMGTAAPDKNTQLYNAPFFNVSGGVVCLGTAKAELPADPTFSDILEYWEHKFWCSVFTHVNGGNPTKSNLVIVTKAAKDAPFPEEELLPMNKTLKSLLK